MMTIWKYEIAIGEQVREIPKGGQILSAQVKRGIPCMWVLVDPDQPIEFRKFEMFETGAPIEFKNECEGKFIGTFQSGNGNFVVHAFEIIKKEKPCPAK